MRKFLEKRLEMIKARLANEDLQPKRRERLEARKAKIKAKLDK